MLDLNLPFTSFVNTFGIVAAIVAVGLIVVGVLTSLIMLYEGKESMADGSRNPDRSGSREEPSYVADYLHMVRLF